MLTTYNKLSELQKQFYGSFSFGGSNGDITLSDSADNKWIGLYIGTGGDVKVTKANGQVQTFKNVPSGKELAIAVTKVWSNGTGASNIIGLIAWDEEIDDVYE